MITTLRKVPLPFRSSTPTLPVVAHFARGANIYIREAHGGNENISGDGINCAQRGQHDHEPYCSLFGDTVENRERERELTGHIDHRLAVDVNAEG